MNKPDFVKILVSSLFFDLVLIFLAPFSGYGIYFILLALMMLVPLYVTAMASGSAMDWVATECRTGDSSASRVSRLLCGSSLAFLLMATGLVVWGELSRDAGLFEILAHLYLFILVYRMAAAALVNVLASLWCLIAGNNLDRVNAVAAFLCSAAGLQICRELFMNQSSDPFVVVLLALNFFYGLVWGGAVQWFVRSLATPEESLPRGE